MKTPEKDFHLRSRQKLKKKHFFCLLSDVFLFQTWNHWKWLDMNKKGWKQLKKVVWSAFRWAQHPKAGQNALHESLVMVCYSNQKLKLNFYNIFRMQTTKIWICHLHLTRAKNRYLHHFWILRISAKTVQCSSIEILYQDLRLAPQVQIHNFNVNCLHVQFVYYGPHIFT